MIKVTINIYEDGVTDYFIDGVNIDTNNSTNDISRLNKVTQEYIMSNVLSAFEQ